jgi:hypothetical protein
VLYFPKRKICTSHGNIHMYSSAISQRIQHNSSDYFDHKILVQCSHSVAGRSLQYNRTFRQSGAARRGLPSMAALSLLYCLSSYALRGASPDLGRLPTSLRPGVACLPTCIPPGSLSPGHDPPSPDNLQDLFQLS